MKNAVKLLFVFAITISGCSTTTEITSSWRKPDAKADKFNNLFIAALTSNVAARQAVENGIQEDLQAKGVTVEKSLDIFPPDFNNTGNARREMPMSKIRATKADAILTIALLKQETETHYVPGSGLWNPGLRYGYYNNFSSYYNNWNTSLNSPGYYDETQVYYLETNLYNAKTEQLIWTAQSKTYDPTSIDAFLKGYLKSIYERMMKDGLISTKPIAAM